MEQRVQFDMKHKHRSATRRTVLGAAFLFCALGWSITCSGPETRYNVILVSIDTLRPDHLGCYGYDRATSPTIDRLAREGIRFENAFSCTTWTLPAHLALLTSLPDIVHGIDIMNNPYVHKDMPQEDLDHLIALYDGEIRSVDELGMRALLQMLDEFGLSKNTLVVVTSDHGEEFFEHGVFGHHQNLFDSTLQIPLVIWGPSLIPFGKSVGRQVRIIDIMPTILDLLNLPQSPEGLGQSLREFWEVPESVSSDRPVFAEVKSWKHYLEALRLPDVKYIRDYSRNEKAMVDLSRDPREIDLLFGDEVSPEVEQKFLELRSGLISYQKGLPWQSNQAPEMDQELRERLKSLGYIK